MTFENIPPLLDEALTARGYTALTPVQTAVIAEEAVGRDLVVSAQTGSGKTVAFGLAMAPQILDGGLVSLAREPAALIIAPTRELALQVSRELMWLYAKAGVRIAIWCRDTYPGDRAFNTVPRYSGIGRMSSV
jgi:ATP-dependent RNA helicase DeaD